jgi:hypothetical protein
MRPLLITLLVLPMLGCAALAPPKEVAQLKPSSSFQETVMLLKEMTNKCWTSEVNPLKDGILINGYDNSQTGQYVITGKRISWGMGLLKNPFIIVTISNSNDKALVSVQEGDFSAGLSGNYRLEAAGHVSAWLNGDRECKGFATTLWHT